MKKGKLIFNNHDARLQKLEISPRNSKTIVNLFFRMFDPESKEQINVRVRISGIGAIDFRINCFDNMIGSECNGLYEILDPNFKNQLVKGIFDRRREIYLMEGDFKYYANDKDNLLNTFDTLDDYKKYFNEYHVLVQNVDAGTYIFMARKIEVIK